MLKTLLFSTQKIKEQSIVSKNLSRDQSPSSTSPPPSKSRRYSSMWSANSSPSSLQQHDFIEANLGVDCSSSATALITALTQSLNNNNENNSLAFVPALDIKNNITTNSEKFINQLNQHNGECATTSSCASSPLKMRNEDEEMDDDEIETHQQQRRHSTMLPASATGAFDSDLMTLSHYHQQRAQLQIAAAAARQQNSSKFFLLTKFKFIFIFLYA